MSISLLSRWLLAALLVGPVAAPAMAQVAATPAVAHPTFAVSVVGKGRPVLLIPDLNTPGPVWDATVARYRGQYQCHVVSLAGFGGVAPQAPVSPHLLQDVRDQLLAYVKAQKLRQPVVVGHSLGGFLALWMAEADPVALGPLEIVNSLPFLPVVQNPAATAETMRQPAEQLRQQVTQGHLTLAAQRQMVASMVTDTARVTQVARWGQASDPATTGQAMYEMYTTDLRPNLGRIQQPVVILGTWAAYQQFGATKASTQAIFETQYAALPHKTLVLSEAGKHFLMYDDQPLFFAQTDALLKQAAGVGK
jgi:N-formylmaleamate deformylase